MSTSGGAAPSGTRSSRRFGCDVLSSCSTTVSILSRRWRPWPVDPLSTGDAGAGALAGGGLDRAPAVALFVERARAADPGFELTGQNAGSVVEVCRRLDGIPLAIELAAARARTIDLADIAARLDERFGLLNASRRGGDPRHRTMEDAISWSFDLLTPEEQELFSALAVFAGPFDLASAESTCRSGDALDVLTRL